MCLNTCTKWGLILFFWSTDLFGMTCHAIFRLCLVKVEGRERREKKHAFFDNHAIFYMCLKMGREGEKNRENLLLFSLISLFGLQREDKWKEK